MVNLKGHDHSLGNIVNFHGLKCDACDRSFDRDGYRCLTCDFLVHKKCVFLFNTQDTILSEHPSHVGHGLQLLTTGAPAHTDPKCHICGKNTKRLLYHCSPCNLNLDIDCMVDAMSSRAKLNMPWHYHPLLMLDVGDHLLCVLCGLPGGYGYCCPRCRLMVHEKCASVFDSPEITHHFHARHSLKLLTQGAPDHTNPFCHVCGKHPGNFLYHCDTCKFNLDMVCAIEDHHLHKLTPVALSNLKVHEHTLTLIPKLISFVCDACGTEGDRSPYVCLQCGLMFFHQKCARLPRVIHVNRHDHRVSYTHPLGRGEWSCGVCLDEIDWSYGAYSCSDCPDYAIHSLCATKNTVWDGIELDGVPEEVEDTEPFKINDDKTITHIAHEHNMSLVSKDGVALEESILMCGACVGPIGSYKTFYNCSSDCGFILHETCANLPKKKRHFLSPRPLTLCYNRNATHATCSACLQMCCNGFMYTDGGRKFDILCSSITVPFIHASHPHPLLYYGKSSHREFKTCQGCRIGGNILLGCIKCNYFLDFSCATLPSTVIPERYGDHPLTLCYGEKASGKYWCDICETETNPKTWFYTSDYGATLHVYCVLGNVRYPKPGGKIKDGVVMAINNTSSRPLCNNCHCRCAAPFFLIKGNELFCSYYCFQRIQMRASWISRNVIRPPWVYES
ncbi:unnamed protein product [Microthlaspi erraticum]|uniref:Phorbol-ester/DAG-type domain-containing protein n=1 Tax=Microthlaspi erraticum TaxID=1685480 RepID=A0A6D2JRJ2_9BRAS|nr:unnamed protein product [Microthlaspi erraticum]